MTESTGRVGLIMFDSMVHPVTTLSAAATNPQERSRILSEISQTAKEQMKIPYPHLQHLVIPEQSGDTEKPEKILDQIFDSGHESPTAINIGR